jgi:hypothetical protein
MIHRASLLAVLVSVAVSGCNSKKQMDIEDPCVQACLDDPANAAGKAALESFLGCLEDTCGDIDSEDSTPCIAHNVSHAEATAACKVETEACFSGPTAGCRELAARIETVCTPTTLPAGEFEMFMAIGCILTEGSKGMPAAQAVAWPLFQCVFPLDGEGGCGEECRGGGAACRACAEQRCGSLYGACMEQSAPAPANPEPPPDKAACQAIWLCSIDCGG